MNATTFHPAATLETLEDDASKELGETPKIRQTALEELRHLISGEPSLRCPTDDAFLVKFLRARKYDEQAAFRSIKKYFKARKDHPEMFQDLTPRRLAFDTVCRKHRLITISRHRDPMGRTAALLKAGSWNAEICRLNDFIRVCLAVVEHFLRWEEAQIRGIVVVVDLKGLGIYHLAHYTPSVIRTVVSLVQIRILGYQPKGLHELVPEDVIPEEHGGTNESYDFDPLEKELEAEEGFFQELGSCGYHDTSMKIPIPVPIHR